MTLPVLDADALAAHERVPRVRDAYLLKAARLLPSLVYLAIAGPLIAAPQPPLWALCSGIALGLLAIGVALPEVRQALRGRARKAEIARTLAEAVPLLSSVTPEEARQRLASLAQRCMDVPPGHRVVVLHVLAYAHLHCGDAARGRALLDALAQSGWLEAFALRRARASLIAGQIIARATMGDLAGAKRHLAQLRGTDRSARIARLVLAVREGAAQPDALRQELALPETAPERASLRLVRLLLLTRTNDDTERQALCDALRADGPRPLRALRQGWPEVYDVARRFGLALPEPEEVPAAGHESDGTRRAPDDAATPR